MRDIDTKKLEILYESLILNEGVIQNIGNFLKNGLDKGLEIFDFVINNPHEFVAILGIISSLSIATKLDIAYKNSPELRQRHAAYGDKVIQKTKNFLKQHPEIINTPKQYTKETERDIAQFVSDNPQIINFFLTKK